MAETEAQWGTPDAVFQITENMQRVETMRAMDRARVDALANGSRPYSEAEMKEFQHQLNVNWLELTRKLQDATGQINNAFLPAGNFFSCHSLGGKPEKRQEYSDIFTKEINRVLKRGKSGKRYHYLLRSRNASVALHGIGPLMWTNPRRLLPRFVPLEDLLIPTDTLLDFTTNLPYFCVNLYLTPGELYRMACAGTPDPGWDQSVVKNILKDLKTEAGQQVFGVNESDWNERPEAIQELYKQNSGYLESDAAPRVRLRAFYYLRNEKQQTWWRKIILRDNYPSQPNKGDKAKFVYESKCACAEEVDHILHCQFGDNSLVSPLRYHSVRGIGTMLYAPALTLNRLRSQAIQHVFQNLLTLWRIQDPNDRDRAKQILLMQNGIVPEGATIIPQTERHQIDPRLLEFGMAQMKQNIAENSSSFTPEVDTGTAKEETAFEVGVKLQAANAMVTNVLSMMYSQEVFQYEELVRRACIKNTDDPLAKKVQERCIKKGVPEELVYDPENWNVIAERALGAGDQAIANSQAERLMANRHAFEPEAQRKIQRLWTATTLQDPQRAEDLVPQEPDTSTSGTRAAEDVYGTLMRGIAVPMRKGIDHAGYVSAILAMMQVEIQRIMQTNGMGTPQDVIGFQMCATSIGETLQWMSQDDRNKQLVRQFADQLGQLMNEVKAMAQRQQEAVEAAQQPQPDPAEVAKIQTDAMAAQQKMAISDAQAQQKMEQKQAQFELKMQQQMEQHALRLKTSQEQTEAALAALRAKTEAELVALGMKTSAEVQATGAKTGADVKATEKKTEADVKASEKKATAAAKSPEKPVDKS